MSTRTTLVVLVPVALIWGTVVCSHADIALLGDTELSRVMGQDFWATCDWPLSCSSLCAPTPENNPDGVNPDDFPSWKLVPIPAKGCMSPALWWCNVVYKRVKCGQRHYWDGPDCTGSEIARGFEYVESACSGIQ